MTRIPYVFVAGPAYSGSTLLSFLLNAHPEVTTLGEMGPDVAVNVDRFRCSCGARLVQCPFYLDLERRVRESGTPFSLREWDARFQLGRHRLSDIVLSRPLHARMLEALRDRAIERWPGVRRRREEISTRIAQIARAALESTGARVFVDTSKDPIRIRYLRRIPSLDLHVIHLIRDVRGVVASQLRRRPEKNAAWAARRWARAHSTVLRVQEDDAPEPWTRLHYSELCDDPQGAIDRIVAKVGLEPSPIPPDFTDQEHHLIGNSMRLTTSGAVAADLSWREQLSPEALSTIARIAGETGRALGLPYPA